MELDETIKNKLTERFIKRIIEDIVEESYDITEELYDIFMQLLDCKHTINITKRGKFTIAEIKYIRNGYEHHFLGVTAKNPNDVEDSNYGIKVAVEEAFSKLVTKFYL